MATAISHLLKCTKSLRLFFRSTRPPIALIVATLNFVQANPHADRDRSTQLDETWAQAQYEADESNGVNTQGASKCCEL
jgi:hypothetical protein